VTFSRRVLARLLIAAFASGLALIVVEMFVRRLDGYQVFALGLITGDRATLGARRPELGGKLLDPRDATLFAQNVAAAPGVDPAWFNDDPPIAGNSAPDPDLDARYWHHKGHELESVYQWNRAYVREQVCTDAAAASDVFRDLRDIYVFDAPNGGSKPPYRFLPAAHYPSGLRTNAFGWRGPEVEPMKPANRLRLAFVGASTTIAAHRDPYSYPEYLAHWLAEWLRERHPGLTVDVINAGREGIDSENIAAIVEHEVLPLSPDMVVYYEGSNQFWPTNFVLNDVPLRLLRTMRPPLWLESHSAAARRLLHVTRTATDGREPPKPPLWVRWPSDLDENDPPLDDPRLPVQLPQILADLDHMRAQLATRGSVLALSSFVWLVEDGLVVQPGRDAVIFDYLNVSYWPFSYAHLRRYIDFENRVFRKYAARHGLPYIDVDKHFPRDPRLFVDGIHLTAAGVKLQAWLVFQQLVQILDAAIASGRLPSVARTAAPINPVLPSRERRLISVEEIRSTCPQHR
jgi:hypothetical protein